MLRLACVLGLALVGVACGGSEPEPVAPVEVESEPVAPPAEPAPEPTPEAAPVVKAKKPPVKKKSSGTDLKREPAGKPVDTRTGRVTVQGDAKTVWLLGDGHDHKYENGGVVVVGAYKVKAWYKNDPVPKVATSVVVAAGDEMVITCSSKAKWCRKGALDVPSMDTGGGG